VVLGLIALVVLGGLLIALVGAVRAPDDVSNSATVLGTFPIDPDAPGIPPGPVDPEASPDAGSVPGGPTSVPGGSVPGTSAPASTGPGSTTSSPAVTDPGPADAFDAELAGWEPVDGDWSVEDGELVVPEASDEAPSFLLRTSDQSASGAEVASPVRAAGVVVGWADPGTYVAALAVPALGGWRLEVRVDGEEVASASVPASTAAGTVVELVLGDGQAALRVDGAEAGTVETAGAAGLGERAGFVARGPAGARWAAAVGGS